MAVQTITYGDKSYLNENADTPATNKVQDTDMNEIKAVVNNNASELANVIDGNIYSTTETQTNKIWIDGSPIYRKVINVGSLPNNTSKLIPTGIDFNNATMVTMYGICKFQSNNVTLPIPFASKTAELSIELNLDNSDNIVIATGIDRSSYNGYVVIEYTKTS